MTRYCARCERETTWYSTVHAPQETRGNTHGHRGCVVERCRVCGYSARNGRRRATNLTPYQELRRRRPRNPAFVMRTRKVVVRNSVVRDPSIRAALLRVYSKCQVSWCGRTTHLEGAHVVSLAKGVDDPSNIVILCAVHHRHLDAYPDEFEAREIMLSLSFDPDHGAEAEPLIREWWWREYRIRGIPPHEAEFQRMVRDRDDPL